MSKDKTSEDKIYSEIIVDFEAIGAAMASWIKIDIPEKIVGTMTPQEVMHISSNIFLYFLEEIASNFDYDIEKNPVVRERKKNVFKKIISVFIVKTGLDQLTPPELFEQCVEEAKKKQRSNLH